MSTYDLKSRTNIELEDAEPLGSALFGKTRRRILGWLFTHTDQSFYVRELAKASGAAQGAISRDLRILTSAGIIRRTVRGREVFFQADETSPIYPELKALFAKTAGIPAELRKALCPLERRIVLAIVHGSAARGQLQAHSDIDLIVVGDVRFGDVVDHLDRAQKILQREINPTVYATREFQEKVKSGDHFLTTVLEKPLFFLFGGTSDVERLGSKRLVTGTSNEPSRGRKPARNRRPRSRGQLGGGRQH